MIRGGNFNNNASNLRSANRNNNTPTNHNNDIGARCAKTVGFLRVRTFRTGVTTVAPGVTIHSPPSRCRASFDRHQWDE